MKSRLLMLYIAWLSIPLGVKAETASQQGVQSLHELVAQQVLNQAQAPGRTSEQATQPSEPFSLKQLQHLFHNQRRIQAYDYATRHLKQMEGDPYFDYLYGVSAIDSGHASEGVFALERVLLSFPNDHLARLELARGYFILQEYALAREAFEQVLKVQPPKKVRDTALAYLDSIRVSESRYRPTHSGFIGFTQGRDDNVNAGVDASSDFPLVSFLSPASLEQDDLFVSTNGAWGYSHPFKPGWSFESSLAADLRKNQDLDTLDSITSTLQLGISHRVAYHRYKAELITQQYQLDGDEYRSMNGLSLNWQYTLSQQSSLNSTLQYAQLEYPELPARDSALSTLGLSYTRSFSGYLQPLFLLSINLGSESADDPSAPEALADTERDIYSLRLGLVLSFSNTWALQSGLGAQVSRYAAAPSFQPDTRREDDYNTLDLGLIWAFSRKWRMTTRYSYTENDSSFDLRDYERNVFDINLSYTF